MPGFLQRSWEAVQRSYRRCHGHFVIAQARLRAGILTRYKGGQLYEQIEPGHIRVLVVFPPQTIRRDEPIQCVLEHVAYDDLTPEYQTWEKTTDHDMSLQPCKARSAWVEHMKSRQPQAHDNLHPLQQLFPHQAHAAARFTWGDYVTLSYCWGANEDRTARHIILNGRWFRVTENLEAALHAIRCSDGLTSIRPWRTKVWVDAICINQKDDSEKEHELHRMKEIYGRAFGVFVHLGPEDEDTDRGVDVLERIANEVAEGIDRSWELLMSRPEPPEEDRKDYTALFKVLTRPYFNRLWILQELAMADAGTLMGCGTRVFPLMHIELAAKFIWHNVESFILMIRTHGLVGIDDIPADVEAEMAKEMTEKLEAVNLSLWPIEFFHQLRSLTHRLEESGNIAYNDLELSVFNLSQNAQSSLQHDKIYGILGIMPSALRAAMKEYTSYSLPVELVFVEFSKAVIEYSARLDIIYLKSLRQSMEPSWATDWRLPPHRISLLHDYSLQGYNQFQYAYDNVRDMVDTAKRSQADGGREYSANVLTGTSILSCSGVFLGKVDGLAAFMPEMGSSYLPPPEHIQPKNQTTPYGDEEATTRALAHTLFANPVWGDPAGASLFEIPWLCNEACPTDSNNFLDGVWEENMKEMNAHNWQFLLIQGNLTNFEALRYHLSHFRIGGKLFKDYFVRDISDCTIPPDRVRLDMCRLIGCNIGRRLITLESGHFGLAPNCAQPDDEVYVIMGCSLPVVLRPVPGTSYHTVVGEGYVEGFASGEAVTGLDEGRFELRPLLLR